MYSIYMIYIKPKRTADYWKKQFFFFNVIEQLERAGSKNTGDFHRRSWRWPVDTVFVFSVQQQHVSGCSEHIAPDRLFPLRYALWVCSFFTPSASKKTASDGNLEENPISSTRTAVACDYRCRVYMLTFISGMIVLPPKPSDSWERNTQ